MSERAENVAIDMVLDFLDTSAAWVRDNVNDYTKPDQAKEAQRKAEEYVKSLRAAMEIWQKHLQQREELATYARKLAASLKA